MLFPVLKHEQCVLNIKVFGKYCQIVYIRVSQMFYAIFEESFLSKINYAN